MTTPPVNTAIATGGMVTRGKREGKWGEHGWVSETHLRAALSSRGIMGTVNHEKGAGAEHLTHPFVVAAGTPTCSLQTLYAIPYIHYSNSISTKIVKGQSINIDMYIHL
jgi:hypothetical protein